jgi:hypothetical protein
LLYIHYEDDRLKEEEMDGTCNLHGRDANKVLVGKLEGKETSRRTLKK